MSAVKKIPSSTEILKELIAFDTTSINPNMDLMRYIVDLLSQYDIHSKLIPNKEGNKANLYATVGSLELSGVMLSGHTDVVPIDGQNWTRPAFKLTRENDLLYGRGTTDMKGFIACSLHAAIVASKRDLKTPLHLAFSYDEEIGCVGVRSMIDMLEKAPVKPAMCIVGEPTSLSVATGHKGKTGMYANCRGREGHSALAPYALNALHLATDFINALRKIQSELEESGGRDGDYDVPYTTVHAGIINGGVALNIVPNFCRVAFEIRNIAEDNPDEILQRIKHEAQVITNLAKQHAEEANIEIEIFNTYPGLNTSPDAKVVDFVKSLTGANSTCKVAFGTEGGLFSQKLGIPTVICGPGSMSQGHKPDEFIEVGQINKCDRMLSKLVEHLEIGL